MKRVRGFARRCQRGAALAGLVLLASGGSLSACRKSAPPVPQSSAAPLPARPSEVVLELVVPEPQTLWPRLRTLAGPLADALPHGPELALASLAGVPALAAGSFDLHAPVVAAWMAGDTPGFVLAARLESGPELIAKLASGSNPTHRVERRGPLSYLSHASGGGFAFAISADTLLLGPERAVERVGPYLARARLPKVPTQGPPFVESSGTGLKTWLAPALRNLWSARRGELSAALARERESRGRPADFAEPEVVLAAVDGLVQRALGVVESTRDARAELSLPPGQIILSLRLTPDEQGESAALLSALKPSSTALLREIPAAAAVALLRQRGPHTSAASDFAKSLFGSRLGAADSALLTRALDDLAVGRGDAEAVALTTDLGLVWRGEVHDADRLRSGLNGWLPLLTRPPLADAFAARWGRLRVERHAQEKAGGRSVDRTSLRFAGANGQKPKRFDLTAQVDEREFSVTLEHEGASLAPNTAGSDPAVATLLDAAGNVAWLAWADLGKLGVAEPATGALLSVDGSAHDGALWFTLRSSDTALRALVARGLGR